MGLGCFSISLTVKDLQKSKQFYQLLGFDVFAGDEAHGYFIMKNGSTNIGLFQGMFTENMMTFNPGWDQNAQNEKSFTDIRALHKHLKSKSIAITNESIDDQSGPANFTVIDPDGNLILFDQHV